MMFLGARAARPHRIDSARLNVPVGQRPGVLGRSSLLLTVMCPVLFAVEPVLTLTADLPALRSTLPETRPTSAWWLPAGTEVRDHIAEDLNRVLARHPELPVRLADLWSATAPATVLTVTDHALAVVPAGATVAPLSFTWKADALLELAAKADQKLRPVHLPVVAWRGKTCTVESRIVPGDDAWTAVTTVKGTLVTGLHPVADDLGHLAQANRTLTLAAGLDPSVVAEAILAALTPGQAAFLQNMLGQRFPEATQLFTGDVLFQGGAEPLPKLALVTRLAPGADPALLAQGVADAFRGVRAQFAGAKAAWTLDTPLGPMTLAWNQERLVLGNDPTLLTPWLAGTPGDMSLPGGLALYGDADLPALAATWLPLGLAVWPGIALDVDALSQAAPRLYESALAQVQAKATAWGQSLTAGQSISLVRGGVTQTFTVSADLGKRWLPEICGQVPADEALAVYTGSDPATVAVVARTAAGWLILDECRTGRRHAYDAENLTRRLAAINCPTLAIGPAPAQQKPIDPPPRTRLDRRWFPGFAGQVSAWRLEGKAAAGGTTLKERGLPAATFALMSAAFQGELVWAPTLEASLAKPVVTPGTEL